MDGMPDFSGKFMILSVGIWIFKPVKGVVKKNSMRSNLEKGVQIFLNGLKNLGEFWDFFLKNSPRIEKNPKERRD